jgi:predicted nucleic acid-binding protein
MFPINPVTAETGEIMGRISSEQAVKGVKIPFDDPAIAAAALEQEYAVAFLGVSDVCLADFACERLPRHTGQSAPP